MKKLLIVAPGVSSSARAGVEEWLLDSASALAHRDDIELLVLPSPQVQADDDFMEIVVEISEPYPGMDVDLHNELSTVNYPQGFMVLYSRDDITAQRRGPA